MYQTFLGAVLSILSVIFDEQARLQDFGARTHELIRWWSGRAAPKKPGSNSSREVRLTAQGSMDKSTCDTGWQVFPETPVAVSLGRQTCQGFAEKLRLQLCLSWNLPLGCRVVAPMETSWRRSRRLSFDPFPPCAYRSRLFADLAACTEKAWSAWNPERSRNCSQ